LPKAEKSVEMAVPLQFFYDMITDYPRYPDFVREVKTSEALETVGNVTKVAFTLRVLTRPFDYVLEMTAEPGVGLSWTLVESKTLKQNDGGWTLEALDDASVRVTYWNDLAALAWIPKRFINALIRVSLPAMLRHWKKLAETEYLASQPKPST
jgi:coenzyme Q-binding protein COQ10